MTEQTESLLNMVQTLTAATDCQALTDNRRFLQRGKPRGWLKPASRTRLQQGKTGRPYRNNRLKLCQFWQIVRRRTNRPDSLMVTSRYSVNT